MTNTAPKFSSNLVSQTIYAGKTSTYGLPGVSDPEGHAVTISLSPAFPWYKATTGDITMYPASSEAGTTYAVTVTLTDNIDSSTYTMSITVLNNLPPSFSPVLSD